MFHRLLFTIATAASLTGLYAVYAALIRPLVVIPAMPVVTSLPLDRKAAHRPVENVRVAKTHLSEQPWAAESQYMLRAGQAFVFTDQWKREENDSQRIRFIPFAMVWLHKDDEGREQAVSIVSESAQVKFASAFDEISRDPGRVVGAVLDGTVQIKGPDGLAIGGRRFIFDESAPSLVSTNPVRFQYGSHSGSGRSLHMKLIPAEGPPGKDRPHVYGIRTVRLGSGTDLATREFEHVRLDVRIPQNNKTKLVKIRCSRDLEFDVTSHTAVFSQEVVASSQTGPNEYDYLECDTLTLQFEPKKVVPSVAPTAKASSPVPDRNSDFQHIETDLLFRRLTAEGRNVKVVSNQNQLRASMTQLIYDAVQNQLQLSDPKGVYVSQKSSTLAVPEVNVQLGADNSLSELVCRGAGRLEIMRPESSELAMVATWARELHKSTDAATGLDLIELHQQAAFLQPAQHTGLSAEWIRLWLVPMPLNLAPQSGEEKLPRTSAEPEPKRLMAERDVALVSPQIVASTRTLDVVFEAEAAPPRATSQLSRGQLQTVSLESPVAEKTKSEMPQPAARAVQQARGEGRERPAARQTAFAKSSAVEAGSLGPPIEIPLTADESPKHREVSDSMSGFGEPLDVAADRIRVRMQHVTGHPQPEVAEVETHGHVRIRQRRASGEQPLTAEGDRLTLHNHGLLREVVHLFGQPAHLRDRGLHVEGREVHLDRGENRVWVKGSGLLQLPIPPGTDIASLGQATDDPDLDVWWHESMEFDGRTASFLGRVHAELGLSNMWCERMDVALSERLSFSKPNSAQQPELESIRCREDVSFDNSEYEGNKLIQVRRGRVAEFTVDRGQGTSFAQGPGQIQILQRDKSATSNSSSRDTMQANRPLTSVVSDWNFTRIDFKGRMIGNIDRQRSTFHDSVRIVHGPVTQPNETIDSDHLPELAGCMRCDKLEFANHPAGPDSPRDYQQLIGWGNARIEGRGFYASADEISFDGSKDLYMLRAHGNQNAMIAQDAERGPRREASGRRIEFIRSRNILYVDRATGANGGQ